MIILSTGSLYNYGLCRVFALAAETGFDGVEVLVDGRWDSRDPAYLLSLSHRYRLPIAALHSPFVAEIQGWPPDEFGRLRHTIKLAQELGVPVVVTHLPPRFGGVRGRLYLFRQHSFAIPIPWARRDPYYNFVRGEMCRSIPAARVMVAVENMPAVRVFGRRLNVHWFNSPEELKRFRHLTLDTTHLGTWGLDLLEVYQVLKDRLVHIHLSNFDGREHRSPPDGHLPLAALLRRLARDDYSGAVSVESDPEALQAEDERKCRVALERALSFCRRHFSASQPP